MADQSWAMKGELVLSCNCTVFCPCVLSLGNHPPTEGYCQTWAGFRIDAGHFGEVDLSGLNLGLIMEIPGYMSRGNWTAGLFIDKRASIYAVKALTKIFTGKAGGTTSLLSILVGKFLGVEQVPITYETRDKTRIFQIPKIIDGAVTPIPGKDRDEGYGDHQFRILDRAGDHRGQVRQEQDARLRPQLEFRRPFGRNLQTGLAGPVSKKRRPGKVADRIPAEEESHLAAGAGFSVHLLTASGSFLAFLSLVAASEERWTAMFWWLGLALFVDGIDGPIARKLEVKEILPTWSGELLDNIIDYVTYVLIPAFALYQRGFMGEGLSFLSAAIIVVSSAIYYADTGMKTKENFFKGFPVVWNMIVFTLFVIEPGEWVSFAVVVVAGILTFVPINFLHPVRVKRLRPHQSRHDAAVVRLRRACAGAGGACRLLRPDRRAGRAGQHFTKIGITVTGLYLFCIGGIMQFFPNLGAKKA